MATATCTYKADGLKTYDFHYDKEELTLDEGDLCLVESEYAAFGMVIVRVESVADNDVFRAKKEILQKIEVRP